MTSSKLIQSKELILGRFSKTQPRYNPPKIRFNGTRLSNLKYFNTFATETIYVNPKVTKEGQRKLADQLINEIEQEKILNSSFRDKAITKKEINIPDKGARAFSEFCEEFLERSKETRDNLATSISDSHVRLLDLSTFRKHLEEVERASYRFEMNLPDVPDDNTLDSKSV